MKERLKMVKGKSPVVQVVPYNGQWPRFFEVHTQSVAPFFGSNYVTAHHIGSTSVPGLWAKPVIDMIVVVHDLVKAKKAIPDLKSLGYVYAGEAGIPFHLYFYKSDCHLHIFEKESPEIAHALCFRAWMASHQDDAQEYVALKKKLAQTYSHDLRAYGAGKNAFIKTIDAKAGFDGLRMVSLLSEDERQAYACLAGKDGAGQSFVFYKGGKIIGAGLVGENRQMDLWMDPCFQALTPLCKRMLKRWADLHLS